MYRVIDLFKALETDETLFPTSTDFDFWDDVYGENASVYDREFARRYADFSYFDFMDSQTQEDTLADLSADVLSLLTINQKRYAEMYRIFLATDQQIPFDYNYDMTETFGATKTTTVYGSHTDTIGQIQDTHAVAPFNSTTPQVESQDTTAQRQDTIGTHTDTVDGQQVTNTRRGNIGVQSSSEIAEKFVSMWSKYKFIELIFEDFCKQFLIIGD